MSYKPHRHNRIRKVSNRSKDEIAGILKRELACIISCDPDTIKENVPLHIFGVDSLSFVEFLVAIEREFGIQLLESGLKKEDFSTIRSLACSIQREIDNNG